MTELNPKAKTEREILLEYYKTFRMAFVRIQTILSEMYFSLIT